MAENEWPVDSPPRHINLAIINKRTITKNNNNMLKSPMAGDRNYNAGGVATGDRLSVLVDTARMQLISPPPEEMLRKNPRASAQFTPSSLANTGTSPVNASTHGTTTAAKRKRTQPVSASSTPLSLKDVDSMNQDNDLGIQSPQVVEATPNPKPRKQGRLHSRQSSPESPTRTTFRDLKVLPLAKASGSALNRTLLAAKSSRRSATPIPPYEPPMDVFTPPREVFLSPALPKSVSKSSKRKTIGSVSTCKSAKGKKKGSTLTILVGVKQELPDIDLSLPMPPASPTDDPLLLSGPPEPEFDSEPTPPRRREMSVQAQVEQEVGIWDGELPPSSPEPPLATDDAEAVRVFDWNHNKNTAPEASTDDSMTHLDPDDAGISPVRLFDSNDVPTSLNGGWSDSEDEGGQGSIVAAGAGGMDEGEEGEGEYTGHWKTVLVRTKQDPPSSTTRGRMEEWGRPISPFPKKLAFLEELAEGEDVHQEETRQEEVHQEETHQEEFHQEETHQEEGHQEVGHHEEGHREEGHQEESHQQVGRQQEENWPNLEDECVTREEEELELEEEEVRRMSLEPEQLLGYVPDSADVSLNVENLRDIRNLELSDEDRTELIIPPDVQHSDDDQSSDDGDELNLVKITSADPRAAARAAAILKQHDYDCYTNIEVKRRHLEVKHRRNSHSDIADFAKESRRRDVSGSGVAKASSSRRRRSTLGMGVIGDRVFIPGSPAITLPELLQEAELDVRDSPQNLSQVLAGRQREDPFKTPLAAKYRTQTANILMASQKAEVYGNDIGEREWTKEDWKYLDACFTDQRLELGSRLAGTEQDSLAPVDMVSINDVVDRFVLSKGGFETVTRFGALWSRENLLERTRALQKKQRSGHIAPPTTPYTPLSVSNNSHVLGGQERAPRMEVPDFTPLGRRAVRPRKSRPTLQQPVIHDTASRNFTPEQEGPIIPLTLLAPRYSHLLEEAINISQEGSTLSLGQEAQDSFLQSDIEEAVTNQQEETQDNFSQSEVEHTQHSYDVPSRTIGKRVKGFLFSYLPTLSKPSSAASKAGKALNPLQPSLPLPPIDILTKPRGPVITPARVPLPKPKHPKELVILHPAPQPSTIPHIPRMLKPRRLVELHPPPPNVIEPTPIPRPRRSSGNSVKDLVRGFEELETLVHNNKLKRTKSTDTGKKYADKRPQWKP